MPLAAALFPIAMAFAYAAQSSGLFGIGLGAVTMIIGLWMLLAAALDGAGSRAKIPRTMPFLQSEITAETEA